MALEAQMEAWFISQTHRLLCPQENAHAEPGTRRGAPW
jgi:hypothetical protein